MIRLEIINLVVIITASLMGIIIAFSIANMSSAYRSLLQPLLIKGKDKPQTIKAWAEVTKEYIKNEIKWVLFGIFLIG
ncbi:MAG: hypothetical protein HY051_01820 [Candidatus Aenigmarchaeota archaeon]|nr:hypothetical protein [Candidatus Aenigmarchaeota archaeon]